MNIIQLIDSAELRILGMSGTGIGAILLAAIVLTWLYFGKRSKK
jgi:hypothetical protein